MKKTKVIVIVVVFILIGSIATIVALKVPNNKIINQLDNITDKFQINKVEVPDESSKVDKNDNGIADPIDIVNSARKEAEQKTVYKDAYYAGGYPPDGEGVCTDVIWRGFKGIDVSVKDLMDKDIKENMDQYKRIKGQPDPNIDFRRVVNQDVFFKNNCISLTTELKEDDIDNLKEWQPGDIVVFIEGYEHIAIISDKRDSNGIPYVIHNAHPSASEAKLAGSIIQFMGITGGNIRINTSDRINTSEVQKIGNKINTSEVQEIGNKHCVHTLSFTECALKLF